MKMLSSFHTKTDFNEVIYQRSFGAVPLLFMLLRVYRETIIQSAKLFNIGCNYRGNNSTESCEIIRILCFNFLRDAVINSQSFNSSSWIGANRLSNNFMDR